MVKGTAKFGELDSMVEGVWNALRINYTKLQ